jgi:hypothetical protein
MEGTRVQRMDNLQEISSKNMTEKEEAQREFEEAKQEFIQGWQTLKELLYSLWTRLTK